MSKPTLANAIVLALVGALVGCAETSAIRSKPRGAAVYVNQEFIGVTPTKLVVPRSQKEQTYEYKIEKDDYQSASGKLSTVVRPGRIVGYFFSFGVFSAFKGPIGFRPVDVKLHKVSEPVDVGAGNDPELPEVITNQLDRLERLKKRKRVDEDQYQQIRKRILGG